MNTSPSLTTIAPALASAIKAIPVLHKDAANPHFQSRYLSLDGLLGAVRGPLLAHGILIVQSATDSDDAGLGVTTRLQHTSGEFIEGTVRMPLDKPTPQAAGSALTYGRRYGLEAILGLTGTEDDDGNAATDHQTAQPVARRMTEDVKRPSPTSAPTGEPKCPKCQGKMWDNRVGKKNPKAPDYKCRDKACDGVIWPPRDEHRIPVGPAFDDLPPDALHDQDDEVPY